jgi:hypothetical protein
MIYGRLLPGTFFASNIVLTIEPTGFFMWGGVNYSQTAKNTSLKQGHYLEATMKKEDGTWGEPQGIDLGDRIQNIDGDLTYVSPQTITSFDPTSKDETLEHGGQKLYAKCLNKAGAYEDTTIDLDKFIGNIDGKHPSPWLPALLQFGLLAEKPEPYPCVLLLCALAQNRTFLLKDIYGIWSRPSCFFGPLTAGFNSLLFVSPISHA